MTVPTATSNRKGSYEHERFDFLGFTFRPRKARNGRGQLFTSFLPAVSDDAAKKIRHTIRHWRIHLWSGTPLTTIAREINQVVRGWVNYYGRFYPTRLAESLTSIDRYLVRWAMRKYKRLRCHPKRTWAFLANVFAREPGLFAHWKVVRAYDRTVGAV
jgi:RNA-directed DNA polymerase